MLGSVGKREFSGDIDVALNIPPEEIPSFIEKLKKNPLVLDIAKSSVIMTKVKIIGFNKDKTDGRPRTGYVQVDFMPGDPGWMKTYYHSPGEDESKYKGVFRNIMIASMAAVLDRQQSDAKLDDGRAMEELRYMWSPTEGLLRVKRTPVANKAGTGYTKKNSNETIDGPWKQPEELLGEGATEQDTHTVESMIKFLRNDPNYDELVAPFEATLEKDGMKLPEAVQTGYTTLADKQLARIKELSGNMGSVVMSSGAFNR